MSHPGNDTQSPLPHDRDAATTNRRVFIARMLGGLTIGVAAFRVLINPTAASAETRNTPRPLNVQPHGCTGACDPCGPGNTYSSYLGHGCGAWHLWGTCPAGDLWLCIGQYQIISRISGQVCATIFDDEGPCG